MPSLAASMYCSLSRRTKPSSLSKSASTSAQVGAARPGEGSRSVVVPLLSVLDAGASFGGVLCGIVGSREGVEDPSQSGSQPGLVNSRGQQHYKQHQRQHPTQLMHLQPLPVARSREPPLVKIANNVHPVQQRPRGLPPQTEPSFLSFRFFWGGLPVTTILRSGTHHSSSSRGDRRLFAGGGVAVCKPQPTPRCPRHLFS